MRLPSEALFSIISTALREDAPQGDMTCDALALDGVEAVAQIVAREQGVLAGVEVAWKVFEYIEPDDVVFESVAKDGERCERGGVLATVSGDLRSMLMGERTAINFMQRMSGIATLTARFVEAAGSKVRITDTRKTAPGIRLLDKWAVVLGGGVNHRFGLSDGVLIKDNHVNYLNAQGLSINDIVTLARKNAPHTVKIEIEADTLSMAEEAIDAGADVVLLDNMATEDMREAVVKAAGRCIMEASGGVTLDNVADVAATGVDVISVGALTHSVKALDISMEIRV